MADTKFTPRRLRIESHPATGVMLRDERGERVGYVYDTDKANLLAAAPELYAALEAVEWGVDDICTACGNERSFGHSKICSINAALRKARGGA